MDAPVAIEDHAVIGDSRTTALVTRSGEIDWMCVPRPDAPPIFGALIGGEGGGRFTVTPREVVDTRRRYLPGSAVLETTWDTSTGAATLTDGFVTDLSHDLLPQVLLVRRLEAVAGRIVADVRFDPRFDLGERPRRSARRAGVLVAEWGSLAVTLGSSRPVDDLASGPSTEVRLEAGEQLTFVLGVADRSPAVIVDPARAWRLLQDTDAWWRAWTDAIDYDGPARQDVLRSLLTLRLLTYAPSGAPVAAPTTSLPEEVGGASNWDYRAAWPRDASLGAAAFLAVGLRDEARAFLRWLSIASRLSRPRVHVLYDVLGRPGPRERTRRDVPGYRGSLPVRTGNAAWDQHQLDVYGWIVDAAWRLHRADGRLEPDVWRAATGWADFVAAHHDEPDAGIWEDRGPHAHHVHSKARAWQALDRALAIAGSAHAVRGRRRDRWRAARDALAATIAERGVDRERGHYLARFDDRQMDASLLLLSSIGIVPADPARPRATIDAVARELDAGDGLLYRFLPEGGGAPREGAFLACSFWMVDALCHTGEVDRAITIFDAVRARANDVGLLGEEIDPATSAHLGNFPQALTHAGLVAAALAIRDATRGRAAAPA